jgi:dTMP kinase
MEPALAAGTTVIADRFFLSTYAYQVAGRGLPERLVRDANLLATGGLVPDLTLLLELPDGAGLERAARRASPDRIETLNSDFHSRVRAALTSAASAEWQGAHPECGPIVAVDAAGSEAEVLEKLLEPLAALWPGTFARGRRLHA